MIVKQLLSTNAGELSPRLSFRNDFGKYDSGCRVLENFICTSAGAAIRRPGLEHIMDCVEPTTGAYARLVPVQVSTGHHAVLVLAGGFLQVIIDRAFQNAIGSVLVDDVPTDTDRLAIPWSDAELPTVKFRQINDVVYAVHPAHAPHKISRYDDDDWRIGAIDHGAIDHGAGAPMLPTNADENRIVTLDYAETPTPTAWEETTDIGDPVIYGPGARVTYGSPAKTYVCQALHGSYGDGNAFGMVSTEPPGGLYSYVVTDGGATYLAFKPVWVEIVLDTPVVPGQAVSLVASHRLFKAGHVGSVWRFDRRRPADKYEESVSLMAATSGAWSSTLEVQGAWNFTTFGNWVGQVFIYLSEDNGATWTVARSYTSTAAIPRNVSASGTTALRSLMRLHWVAGSDGTLSPYALLACTDADIRGWVRITAVGGGGQTATGEALSHLQTLETFRWAEGAWSGEQGYPGCVELHQSRLCYAGTAGRPHTIWGSAIDDYDVFSGGTAADSSYAHTLVVGERDPILWLISDRFLMAGGGGSEFMVYGATESAPITAEAGTARRQSTMGADARGICAAPSETVPLFVQRGGDRICELQYNYDNDRFAAANLCLLADHLHRGKVIMDMALQRVPHQILWVVDDAGGLCGYTYERGNEVAGWHRHPSAGATFLSVCAVRGEDSEDIVYLALVRNGLLVVESFGENCLSDPALSCVWTDGAVRVTPADWTPADALENHTVNACWNGYTWTWGWTAGLWLMVTGWLLDTVQPYGGKYFPAGTYGGSPKWVRVGHEALGSLEDFIVVLNGRVTVYSGGAPAAWLGGDDVLVSGESILATTGETASLGTVRVLEGDPISLGRDVLLSAVVGTWHTWKLDGAGKVVYRHLELRRTLQFETHDGTAKWTQRAAAGTVLFYAASGAVDVTAVTWKNQVNGLAVSGVFSWVGAVQPTEMIIGLPYTSVYQPMPLQLTLANGSSRSRELRVHRVVPDLEASYGGRFGPSLANLLPIHEDFTAHTGEVEKGFPGGHDLTGDLFVTAEAPAPFILRGVTVKFNVHGDQG